MNRIIRVLIPGVVTFTLSGVLAADTAVPVSPDAMPAEDAIAARNALMMTMEQLMIPIDTFTVDESIDHDVMRNNAASIAAMLLSVPHLFPAASNRYDPAAQYKETLGCNNTSYDALAYNSTVSAPDKPSRYRYQTAPAVRDNLSSKNEWV